jgi:hypothetical protein
MQLELSYSERLHIVETAYTLICQLIEVTKRYHIHTCTIANAEYIKSIIKSSTITNKEADKYLRECLAYIRCIWIKTYNALNNKHEQYY